MPVRLGLRGVPYLGIDLAIVGDRSRRIPGALSAILAGSSIVALYIWDDVLLAGPIVAVTAAAGPLIAFLVCGSLYGLVSFVLAIAGVRAYEHWSRGNPSRMAQWLDRQRSARRAGLGQRLLGSGKVVGFLASSFLLGGIVTTFLVRYSGRTEGMWRVAAASSLVFAITFVGFYTGIAQAVFSL